MEDLMSQTMWKISGVNKATEAYSYYYNISFKDAI